MWTKILRDSKTALVIQRSLSLSRRQIQLLLIMALAMLSALAAYLSSATPQEEPSSPSPTVQKATAAAPTEEPCESSPPGKLSPELVAAVEKGDIRAVRELLAKGADPNTRAKYCESVLMVAAERPATAISEALIAAGAEVNSKDNDNLTPLGNAESSDKAMIDLLRMHGGK